MRRCKIVTWIVILSIVNFALGAPAAVRERLEASVDVDVAEGGTATSQKRYDPLDGWSTTNAADRPSSLNPSDLDRLWEQLGEEHSNWNMIQLSPESPGSTESEASNFGSPIGSHPGPTDGSPLPSLPHLGPPAWSVNPDTLSSTGHQSTPPQSPTRTGGSPPPPLLHWHPGPSEDRSPSTTDWSVNLGTLSSTGHQPTPPQSPTPLHPLPDPGSSEEHCLTPYCQLAKSDTLSSTGSQPTPPQSPMPPPDPGSSEEHCQSPHCWLAKSDTLSSTGSQPTPLQSPAWDPAPVTPPSPSLESSPDEFLEKLLTGRIKRRVLAPALWIRRRGTQGQQIFQLDDLPQLNGWDFDRFLKFPCPRRDPGTPLHGLPQNRKKSMS